MKNWVKILLAVVAVGVIAAIAVYVFVINKPKPDYVKEEPARVVRAKRIYTDYTVNPGTADQNFLGKLLLVEGNITRVEDQDSLVVLVYVFDEGDFGEQGVRITMLPDYMEQAKKISPLKPVKVKALCTGFNGTDVIFEKGSLDKPEP